MINEKLLGNIGDKRIYATSKQYADGDTIQGIYVKSYKSYGDYSVEESKSILVDKNIFDTLTLESAVSLCKSGNILSSDINLDNKTTPDNLVS